MEQTDEKFSTQAITSQLLSQIVDALRNKAYGSVEIYVENYRVVQITERTINKLRRPEPKKKFSIIRNTITSQKYSQVTAKGELVNASSQH